MSQPTPQEEMAGMITGYWISEDLPERFRLYRVFDFSRRPRLFVIKGALSAACRLEAVQYRALIG